MQSIGPLPTSTTKIPNFSARTWRSKSYMETRQQNNLCSCSSWWNNLLVWYLNVKKKNTYDTRIPKAHILCNTSVECRVAVEVQGRELRNTDNFLFGRWEIYVSVSLLEPTMPITRATAICLASRGWRMPAIEMLLKCLPQNCFATPCCCYPSEAGTTQTCH